MKEGDNLSKSCDSRYRMGGVLVSVPKKPFCFDLCLQKKIDQFPNFF